MTAQTSASQRLPGRREIARALDNLPLIPEAQSLPSAGHERQALSRSREGVVSSVPLPANPLITEVVAMRAAMRLDMNRAIRARMGTVEIRRDDQQATIIGWGVWVGGYQHGGRLHSFVEALAHAARCRDWTTEEYAEWIETHAALGIEVAA